MRIKSSAKIPNKSFTIIIFLIYFLFLGIDCFFPQFRFYSNLLKWSAILLCLLHSWSLRSMAVSKRDWQLLTSGLALTLICDSILLFFHVARDEAIGLFLFCLVHLLYIYRLKSTWIKAVCGLIGVIILPLLFIQTYFELPLLYLAAVLYAFLLITDCFASFRQTSVGRVNLIRLAMICFLLCDINVALNNLQLGPAWLSATAQIDMWLFYLPAQYCLTNSLKLFG